MIKTSSIEILKNKDERESLIKGTKIKNEENRK